MTAEVHFLSDEAPDRLLRPGARFTLREGKKIVAQGQVLERLPTRPPQPETTPR